MNIDMQLSVYRGDDKTFSLTFTDSGGGAIDISGWTIFFTVKKQANLSAPDDTDALIQKDIVTHDDPINGKTNIVLTPADTNITPDNHFCDIQTKDDSGNIGTVAVGLFEVHTDVTRRTSA